MLLIDGFTAMRQILKKIPGLVFVVTVMRNKLLERSLARKSTSDIFTDIFRNNKWGSEESVSGPGSSLKQTGRVRDYLAHAIASYQIRHILDVPCGDFNWMKHVNLNGVHYTGIDIVHDLVENNIIQYGQENISFSVKDITKDPLGDADLILCRDCLMHLSNRQVFLALDNFCKTSSKYLLTTSFVNTTTNTDIAHGQWRPINLMLPPFSIGTPLEIINEGLEEDDGKYSDKSLVLWKLDTVRESLKRLN